MTKFYIGVGSRSLPPHVREAMIQIGEAMALKGYVLRSGGAEGADEAFQLGCMSVMGVAEVIIPWNGFMKTRFSAFNQDSIHYRVPNESQYNHAKKQLIDLDIMPWFDNMKSQGAKKLHARNYYQVFSGEKTMPKVCIYYCEETATGEPTGGTRTAVKLAQHFGIPCYNLLHSASFDKLEKKLKIKLVRT